MRIADFENLIVLGDSIRVHYMKCHDNCHWKFDLEVQSLENILNWIFLYDLYLFLNIYVYIRFN